MNHVYWVQQTFDIVPAKKHHSSCINYKDLQEFRDEFCEELVNTIPEWIYSNDKAAKIIDEMITSEKRSAMNANSALRTETFRKFRNLAKDEIYLQGQFGELILFNFLQAFFGAVPLIRKMPLTTSDTMERFGADAIHYDYKDEKHLIFLGEAKAYTAKYQFAAAFEDALLSIISSYNNHRRELKLYIYDDFLDDQLVEIAKAYKNGTLTPIEIHLVSIIMYNETKRFDKISEVEIKKSIMEIVKNRADALDKSIFSTIDSALSSRFNYIIFPIWEMDKLLKDFQRLIGR